MTLIAGLRVNGFPMVFGDALLSGPSETGLECLPAVTGLRAAFEDWPRKPIALCQKVALIGDNVAVAWSGPQVAARSLLRDWVAQARQHSLSRSDIEASLGSIENCQANRELQLIGMVADGTAITGFTHNIPKQQLTSAGPIEIAGSGTDDFVDDLNAGGLPVLDPHLPEFDQAMAMAVTITGRMLALELHGGWNLPSFYGGAYEAAFFHDGRFQKASGVTYAFWVARPHASGVELGAMPVRLMRQSYVDDVLVFRTASPTLERNQWLISEHAPHVIGPVYREPHPVDLTSCMGSFASDFICNLVICTNYEGVNRAVLSRVDARRGDDQPISFTTTETGSLRLSINRAGIQDLVNGITPFYEKMSSTA